MNTFIGEFTDDEKFFLNRRFRGFKFQNIQFGYMATKGNKEFFAYSVLGLASKINLEMDIA